MGSASPSSSSSSSSSEGDDPPKTESNIQSQGKEGESESEEDDTDDFFAAENVSAGDVFAQLQKDQTTKKQLRQFGEDDQYIPGQKRKADKSKGFLTQKQSKREFRAYQQRQRRQKLG